MDSESDRQVQVLNDLEAWVWGTKLQMERFVETVNTEFERAGAVDTNRERAREFSRFTPEHYFMLCAVRQIIYALERVKKKWGWKLTREPELEEAVKALRGIHEHWVSQREPFRSDLVSGERGPKKSSGKKWEEMHPEKNPFATTLGSPVKLGEGIDLGELATWVHTLDLELEAIGEQLLGES